MSKSCDKEVKDKNGCRICSVGGEALMEGIMMRAPAGYSQVVRKPDGTLDIQTKRQAPMGAGNKFLNLPIVRGTVRLADSLIVGTRALFNSAEISATEDDPSYSPTKFDLWVEKHFGDKAMDILMVVSLVLSLCLSVGLFFVLPQLIADGIEALVGVIIGSKFSFPRIAYSAIEGFVRIAIFFGYMLAISLMKDIRRVFMYHGAEHKTIHCYEHYDELTVENVRKHSKHHPRCGTAFLFVVMIISILVHALIPDMANYVDTRVLGKILNLLLRIATIPVIAGIAYEFNKYAGSHENGLVKVLRAPGLFMQRFTTKEPDDDMIEVAIVALKEALKLDEQPNYSAEKNNTGAENNDTKAENNDIPAENNAAATTENSNSETENK